MKSIEGSGAGQHGQTPPAGLQAQRQATESAGPRSVSAASAVILPGLRPGHCGSVVEISADDDDAHRLMAMGVCVGRRVELVQAGDPLILRVLGCRIGVSARLAARVRVEVCHEPQCAVGGAN